MSRSPRRTGLSTVAQLVKKIRSTLRLNISDIVLHTDSTIALAWLNAPANRLKTFVANRVAKVQELTEGFQWNHVPSVLNPADLVSRGLRPCDLPNLRLWWHGPQFLEKAIHIEIVSDLTSDAFIATLKRFFSRRGKCAKLYSDNGKTFVGANKELKRFLKLIEDSVDNLAGFLSAEASIPYHYAACKKTFGSLFGFSALDKTKNPRTISYHQSSGASLYRGNGAPKLHCGDWYFTYMVPYLKVIPTTRECARSAMVNTNPQPHWEKKSYTTTSMSIASFEFNGKLMSILI
ncbi:integrase catalytic domain-containing protein [Trichonephila clavipes]|nr:integrase catalytic domain-containing protein [Trichonephila clavipes]